MKKQTIILSWIAIALSITACIITFLDLDKAQITDDSFIGVMASFIGVIATILVGVQIFNSIETRNSINKLNESFEKKIKEVESNYHKRIGEIQTLNNQLQYDLTKQNKRFEQAKKERVSNENKIQSYIHRVKGITLEEQQPFTAILEFVLGIEYALDSKDIKTIHRALDDLGTCVNRVEDKSKLNTVHSDSLDTINPSNLSKYDFYYLIEDKYVSLYEEIIKIKDKAKNQSPK